jgi:type I restriction enzyme R subunit
VAAAAPQGPGHNSLVQHSAGSAKSNIIGWLAHRLAGLHGAADNLVFDSVIVMTDRQNLDNTLRVTGDPFDHNQGGVHKVEKDLAGLAKALYSGACTIPMTL